jgi:hypothetical protein
MKKKNYKWVEEDLKYIRDTEGKDPARTKRFIKQYEARGWCDIETWSLDHSFAVWMVPRLQRFIELTNGYPGDVEGMTNAKWHRILKEMLEGFKFMLTDDWYAPTKRTAKKHAKALKALKLFGEWARYLWW